VTGKEEIKGKAGLQGATKRKDGKRRSKQEVLTVRTCKTEGKDEKKSLKTEGLNKGRPKGLNTPEHCPTESLRKRQKTRRREKRGVEVRLSELPRQKPTTPLEARETT